MTRARRTPLSDFLPADPVNDAVIVDTMGLASELGDLLETLKAFDQSSIHAIAFKKPPEDTPGSKSFQLLGKYGSPVIIDEIVMDLKNKYGGGEYRITIMAGGKPRKQIEFPIFGEPIKPGIIKTANDPFGGGGDFFKMMMLQQAEQQRNALEMTRLENERRDRAAERQNALIGTAIAAAMPALIPILAGSNREKLSDVIALMQSNKPEGSNLKELVETLVLLKGLTGDGDKEGFNPDDLVGSIARMGGPMLAAAGRAFNGRNGGAPAGDVQPEPEPLYLPESALTPALTHTPPAAAAAPSNPLLALIKPHVLYFYSAQLPPGLAADGIVDIMDREGVDEGEVLGLVAAYTGSADWLADLADQGIDLRGHPDWANDFLRELIAAWSDPDGGGDGGTGAAGGHGHPDSDERPGAPGLNFDAREGEGPPADE